MLLQLCANLEFSDGKYILQSSHMYLLGQFFKTCVLSFFSFIYPLAHLGQIYDHFLEHKSLKMWLLKCSFLLNSCKDHGHKHYFKIQVFAYYYYLHWKQTTMAKQLSKQF